jgi:ankyrin repeat protein
MVSSSVLILLLVVFSAVSIAPTYAGFFSTGQEDLVEEAYEGNVDIVNWLLGKAENNDVKNKDGWTALMGAVLSSEEMKNAARLKGELDALNSITSEKIETLKAKRISDFLRPLPSALDVTEKNGWSIYGTCRTV